MVRLYDLSPESNQPKNMDLENKADRSATRDGTEPESLKSLDDEEEPSSKSEQPIANNSNSKTKQYELVDTKQDAMLHDSQSKVLRNFMKTLGGCTLDSDCANENYTYREIKRTYSCHFVQNVKGSSFAEHEHKDIFRLGHTGQSNTENYAVFQSVIDISRANSNGRTLEWCLARTWSECSAMRHIKQKFRWTIRILGLKAEPRSITLTPTAGFDFAQLLLKSTCSQTIKVQPGVEFKRAVQYLESLSTKICAPNKHGRDYYGDDVYWYHGM
jgi:hypothetical protein